jgi:LCP family protein required for cell wall assembly
VLVAGGVIVTMCLIGTAVAAWTLHKYQSIERVDDLAITSAPPGEPENYLVVAVDSRDNLGIKNTDTMMVVRVDPRTDRVALTSFNRDLMVAIADTGRLGMLNSAYNRPDGGEQVLIDTIRQNFDIPINHFVEVNFDSFKQVVDAVGGVPMWFPTAVRDTHSGLYQYSAGCITLDGAQGLAFARARYLQIRRPDGSWDQDGSADLGRVQRQQIFIQRAVTKALAQIDDNPARMRELLDIGVSNVRIDKTLSLGDLLNLGKHFRNFDPKQLEAYQLPVVEYAADRNRLLLDSTNAEPFLNVFRGLALGEVRPGVIDVSVQNGTQGAKPTLAGDISGALAKVGFKVGTPEDAPALAEHTTVFHAKGENLVGQRVARHLTVAAKVAEDPTLAPGHVRLVAGLDFTTVHDQPAPLVVPKVTTPKPGATATTPTTATPSTVPKPTTTTTEPTGFLVGTPPPGKQC